MSLLLLPSPTHDQAAMDEKTKRRGSAVQLICGCCRLPFSELTNGEGGEGLTIYSRHYGMTHTNPIKFQNVELVVTDRREFVIVPSQEIVCRLATAGITMNNEGRLAA